MRWIFLVPLGDLPGTNEMKVVEACGRARERQPKSPSGSLWSRARVRYPGRLYSSLAISQEEIQPSETALLTASPRVLTPSLS